MSGAAAASVAVGAAALLGCSSVAQRRAMAGLPAHGAGDPRLVAVLARRGWWWAGTLASVAGLGLQVLALTLGPLITVQITMTCSIVAAALAEWWLLGRRPTPRTGTGIVLTAAGLVTALLALAPTAGAAGSAPTTTADLVGAGLCAAAILGAVGLDRWSAPVRGSGGLGLAVATGLGYGFTAIQLKIVGTQLGQGSLEPLGHPSLALAALVGPVSILLSQNALQRSRRVVATVSLILVIDPLVGLAAGVAWFGERVACGPAALIPAGLGAAALVTGIVLTQAGSDRRRRTAGASTAPPLSHPTPNRVTSPLHPQRSR